MKRKAALIHTGFALVNILSDLFAKSIPQVELIHIVDDSLLKEVMEAEKVTPRVTKKMCGYMIAAEETGAEIILNVCSSVSEVVDTAKNLVNIPVIKIDEAMAEAAVQKGGSIGVLATLKTTLDPTCRLLENRMSALDKKIDIKRDLCPGAFDMLMAGDLQKHDDKVLEGIRRLSGQVDVIVLAQGSMARLIPQLRQELSIPVLSSLESGVKRVSDVLKRLERKRIESIS